MKGKTWLLLLLSCCLTLPAWAQSSSTPPLCMSYDRWSLEDAFVALGEAGAAQPPNCSGSNWQICRDIDTNFLYEAQDHLEQIFYGETTYMADDCLNCNMDYMVLLAEALNGMSEWLQENGYRNDYHLTLSRFQQWENYPYCSTVVGATTGGSTTGSSTTGGFTTGGSTPPSNHDLTGKPDLSCAWTSTYGKIHWDKGYYGSTSKTISGGLSLADGKWVYEGRWGRKNGDRWGKVFFTFDSPNSFKGYWTEKNGSSQKSWTGSGNCGTRR